MFKLKRGTRAIEFCERCGSVCDQACRLTASREQVRLDLLRYGGRFS